jgi:spore coat polysaccharide biosynthesis protein SpsF
MVRTHGYRVCLPPEGVGAGWNEGEWLLGIAVEERVSVLLLDVPNDVTWAAVRALRSQGVVVVTLDHPARLRLVADLAFYPPVPQVRRLDWSGFTGELFVGWDWIVLRPEFARRPESLDRNAPPVSGSVSAAATPPCPTVLVTMGGSDPAGLTLKVLAALDLLERDVRILAALGSGFLHAAALEAHLSRAQSRTEVRRAVRDMAGVMVEADLAIASFGMTAYELAAVGVPSLLICLTEDHAESATALVELGTAISLGLHGRVTSRALAAAVSDLLASAGRRRQMALRGVQAIDGRGAKRIAAVIDRLVRRSLGDAN